VLAQNNWLQVASDFNDATRAPCKPGARSLNDSQDQPSTVERAGPLSLSSLSRRRVFFFLASLFAFWIMLPLWPGLVVGAALAYLSEPLNSKLLKIARAGRRGRKFAAVSISTVLILGIAVLLPFTAVVVGALEQITLSLNRLNGQDAVLLLDRLLRWAKELILFLPIKLDTDELTNILTNAAQFALTWVGQNTGRFLAELPQTLFVAAIALVSWIYFLMVGRQLRIVVLRFLLPWPTERALLRTSFSELLRSLVMANILVSLVQAIVIGIFLAFVGVPHVMLWTSASFFLSFIPVVGTAPITLGSALWCWTMAGSPEKAIAMAVCALIAGTSDNFLRPLMARGSIELNPYWLFLAMMGGLAQFGAAGFIAGPLALTLTMASANALRHALKNARREKTS
jgi:predicted PurR-regulated permease PerM